MQLAQYVIDKVNGMDVDIDGKETEENAADGKPSLVALKAWLLRSGKTSRL